MCKPGLDLIDCKSSLCVCFGNNIRGSCKVFIHTEGENLSSIDGVNYLLDHNSFNSELETWTSIEFELKFKFMFWASWFVTWHVPCAGSVHGLAWLSRSQILYRDKVSKLMYCGDELRQIWRSRNAGLFKRQSPPTLPASLSPVIQWWFRRQKLAIGGLAME